MTKNKKRWREEKGFLPHNFSPKVELLGDNPFVLISRLAYDKMRHYVDIACMEVGWLGTVTIDVADTYLIDDVFLLRQEVTSTSTELAEEGLIELAEEILSWSDGVQIYERVRFWGHSHVNMDTGPSPQDDAQMEFFERSDHPFFLRGILNKKGRMSFTLYRYDLGVKVIDVPWNLYELTDEALRREIEEEFSRKVAEVRYSHQSVSRVLRRERDDGILKTDGDLFPGKTQKSPN